MLIRNLLFTIFLLLTTGLLFPQSRNDVYHPELNFKENTKPSDIALSGHLNIDNKISFDAVRKEGVERSLIFDNKDKKSPWLGTLFSLVLPGAGEFYAESYLKAGIFLAVEAAVVTTAVIYNKKGNDETNVFQNYANQNWSVVRYAQWLNKFRGGNITIIDDPSLPPWKRVNFSQIHEAENLPQNSDLSHNLAAYGEQQYYEMIGKYDQFASGWDDFDPNQSTTKPISPNFEFYSGLRGKANNYYAVASTAVIGIYLNHFLSAIDAYWSTTVYNKELVVKMTVENQRYADTIELVPTINLKLSF